MKKARTISNKMLLIQCHYLQKSVSHHKEHDEKSKLIIRFKRNQSKKVDWSE